jgi:hypothetical protein
VDEDEQQGAREQRAVAAVDPEDEERKHEEQTPDAPGVGVSTPEEAAHSTRDALG